MTTETLSAEKQAEDAFASGFDDATPPASATAAETKPEAVTPEQPANRPKPKPPATPPAPEWKLTQAEWNALDEKVAKRIRDTISGTSGELEQRLLKKLQPAPAASQTPATAAELPADVVAEMEKDFPELASHVKSALTKALKGFRGNATAEIDPEKIRQVVRSAHQQAAAEALADEHPDWKDIVGTVDAEGRHDPNHPFRSWLAKKDAGYQKLINDTDSADVIRRAINRFRTEAKAPKPTAQPAKNAARENVLRKAATVQPKGIGGQPAPATTLEDQFAAGFSG